MSYSVFGKAISRKFYPLINDNPNQLPSQNPTIYVFTSQPTLNDARDGGGAQQTISTWSQNSSSPYECTYTIAAIEDPDPESAVPQRTYYVAINYVLVAAGQVQTVLQTLDIERASGTDSVHGITYSDLVEVYPAITAYASNNQLGSIINIAQDELELKLRGKGIRLSDVQNIDEARRAIAYRAIQLLSEAQISTPDDKWATRREIYKEKFQESLKDTILYVDTNRDGIPDSVATGEPRYVIVTR